MKRTLSRVRNRSNKAPDSKNNTKEVTYVSGNRKNNKVHIYNANVTSPKKTKETDDETFTEKSATTYEAFSSTSESDPEGVQYKRSRIRACPKELSKSGITNKGVYPEVCITVSKGGKDRIRIVRNTPVTDNAPEKQVDFASLDAVYGVTSEELFLDEAVRLNGKNPMIYRAANEGGKTYPKGLKNNIPSGSRVDEEDPSSPEWDTADENKGRIESPQTGDGSRTRPSLTTPIISMSIQTSREELTEDDFRNNVNTSQNPSSRLFRLKQHLLKNGVGSSLDNKHNEIAEPHELELEEINLESGKNTGRPGDGTKNEIYYIDEIGEDVKDALEQFIKTSKHSSSSRDKHPSVKNKNSKYEYPTEEIVESINKHSTRPIVYEAILENKNVFLDENARNMLKNDSKLRTASIIKGSSKQFPKKRSEVIGSKIGLKKSNRSFLKPTIPKPSVSSRKRSSISVAKMKNVEDIGSKSSKRYVIRDIMVIPEYEEGKQFASVYPGQSLILNVPEESVEQTEREIRLHDLDNAVLYNTENKSLMEKQDSSIKNQHISLQKNSIISLKNGGGLSIPCLYYCSTSTVDMGFGAKNNGEINTKVECDNAKKSEILDTSVDPRQQDNGAIHGMNISSNPDQQPSTFVIDPKTHREIMKAILDSNGKYRIITLPTKISPKDSAGQRLLLGDRNSKGSSSLTKRMSFAETIEEESQDENNNKVQVINNKQSEMLSNYVTSIAEGTYIEELDEGKKKVGFETDKDSTFDQTIHAPTYLTFPSNVRQQNPLKMKLVSSLDKQEETPNLQKKRKIGSSKRNIIKSDKKRGKLVTGTILSFCEPVKNEDDESQNVSQITIKSKSVGDRSKRRKLKSASSKFMKAQPETMVYVGKLPNTTYNVFFSPDNSPKHQENDEKRVESETKLLNPIRSEKLLAQGPKAILIFVNKKTELNRNPFDGNVMSDHNFGGGHRSPGKGGYGANDRGGRGPNDRGGRGPNDRGGRGPNDRGKQDRDKRGGKGTYGKGKSDENSSKSGRSGKSVKTGVSGKSGKSGAGAGFDISSIRDPGRRGTEEEGVVVEKSPSGLKTVIKYPCGCMKITKIDPGRETASEEITSAFCTLGSKCAISNLQKDERLLQYMADGTNRSMAYSGRGYRQSPGGPFLDIVVEGLMSKKPIKSHPPAPTMRGANLTGTLSIKTNKCNGVINFYIDPRLKQYLRNNLAGYSNDTGQSPSYQTNASRNQPSYQSASNRNRSSSY